MNGIFKQKIFIRIGFFWFENGAGNIIIIKQNPLVIFIREAERQKLKVTLDIQRIANPVL